MWIDRMAAAFHIRSKIGKMIFRSALIGLLIFLTLSIVSMFLKVASNPTILGVSVLIAIFGATLYFIKSLEDKK